jgi:hypothetical protein
MRDETLETNVADENAGHSAWRLDQNADSWRCMV